jgi:molybdate transport system substrate-binding protein
MSEEVIIGAPEEPGLQVLCASALRQALTDCAQAFQAGGGGRVSLSFDTSGGILKRLGAGETPDVGGSSLDVVEDLRRQGAIVSAAVPVGTSRIALGIRKGEAAPDISTLAQFKAAMLAAQAIARGDPAGGGTAGNYLQTMLERIGLLEAVAAKSILRVGGYKVMAEVAEHRADFGLTQSTEIAAVPGVEIGGWLPDEIQLTTAYGLGATAQGLANPRAGAFLDFVAGGAGRDIFRSAGFAPSGA